MIRVCIAYICLSSQHSFCSDTMRTNEKIVATNVCHDCYFYHKRSNAMRSSCCMEFIEILFNSADMTLNVVKFNFTLLHFLLSFDFGWICADEMRIGVWDRDAFWVLNIITLYWIWNRREWCDLSVIDGTDYNERYRISIIMNVLWLIPPMIFWSTKDFLFYYPNRFRYYFSVRFEAKLHRAFSIMHTLGPHMENISSEAYANLLACVGDRENMHM